MHSDPRPSPKTLREKMEFSILWQGNPVAVQKSFGTKSCYLCMKERTHILKGMYSNAHSMINNNSEIYSSCRHKTRFHRFPHNSTGTDESTRGRKSCSPSPSSPENLERNSTDRYSNTYNTNNNPYSDTRTRPTLLPLSICTRVGTRPSNDHITIYTNSLTPKIFVPNSTCELTCASDSRTIEI